MQLYISTVSEKTGSTCVARDTLFKRCGPGGGRAHLYAQNDAKCFALYKIKLVREIGARAYRCVGVRTNLYY